MRAVRSGGLWRTNYFPLRSRCLRHGHVTLTDDPMLTRGREGEGTGRDGRGGEERGGDEGWREPLGYFALLLLLV